MPAGPNATLQDVTEKHSLAPRPRLIGAAPAAEATQRAVPRSVGRYTLYDEIASGGMGAVHLGMLEGGAGFRRPVAIKRLHDNVGERGASDELRQEAWLGSRVR